MMVHDFYTSKKIFVSLALNTRSIWLLPPASEWWREVMSSQACFCPTFGGGGGTPSAEGGGDTLIRSWWGVLQPSWGGVPHSSWQGFTLDEGTPHWDWMGIPPIRTGCCTPPPIGTGWGYPLPFGTGWGYFPLRFGWGYPLPGLNEGTPPSPHQETEQLRDGRYTSCVHPGGLSCCRCCWHKLCTNKF